MDRLILHLWLVFRERWFRVLGGGLDHPCLLQRSMTNCMDRKLFLKYEDYNQHFESVLNIERVLDDQLDELFG